MKPVYLKMTAFGSYCGTAEIDFTKLYDNGIFLITGKTGGGKTTILDAMCVALYGKATGSERAKDWKQLRCSNAPSSLDTEIEFTFSIDDTKYKFYRRWHLPKTKSGEIKVNDEEDACYIMHEGETDWTPLASGKASVVNEAAESILKLNQNQFVKVIMLPQGEFRELLIASSDEKEKIFKKLFDTERWEQITERISQEYHRLDNELSEHAKIVERALQSTECKSAAELELKINQCNADIAQLKQKSELNEKQIAVSVEKLKAAETDILWHNELDANKKTLALLNTQSQYFADMQSRLSFSRKLREVESEYRLMLAAGSAQIKIQQELLSAELNEKKAADALAKAEQSKANLENFERRKNELLADIANYGTLASSHREFELAQNELKSHRASLDDWQNKLTELNSSKKQVEENIEKGAKYLEQCHEASDRLISVKEHCNILNRLYNNTDEYEKKSADLELTKNKLSEKYLEYAAQEEKLDSLMKIESAVDQKIRSDMAYSIAADLTEGTPCPVCGSIHHPHPAQPADCTPNANELEICKKNTEYARKALEAVGREISSLTASHDSLQSRINELVSANGGAFASRSTEIKSELDSETKRSEDLQKLISTTNNANERLNFRKKQLESITKSIEAANEQINRLNISISKGEQLIKIMTEQLRNHGIADFNALYVKLSDENAELKRVEAKINAVNSAFAESSSQYSSAKTALENAKHNLSHADKDFIERQAAFKSKCERSGIAQNIGDADIMANLLASDEEDKLDREIKEYGQHMAIVKKRISELNELLNGRDKPQTDAIRAENEALASQAKEIAESIGQRSALHKNLKETAELVLNESKIIKSKEHEYSAARRLHRLCSGNNDFKTPLHQYVIGIKMDEVIMSANIYLSRLTKGQYSLVKKQNVSGRDRHQGLNIEILDSNIGGMRGVSTLSGGELFLASLSLAFGLSDVVQSFAGGIHLDSLFIDEGFGSLDSETLDTAMDAITAVRENKLLGIISHVSELKERIPYGIEVVKAPDGSTLKMRI